MNEPRAQIGRLAMRVEGDKWVAYYAMPDTMNNAIWLGSILLTVVQDEARKQAFMNLMREIVGDHIEAAVGVRPTWGGPRPGPEHERAGRG